MKPKPFYQGRLDVFCAIYAVLNGLRLTHGIRTLKARNILNDTLLGLASNPKAFETALNQETDYIALVDSMLSIQSKKLPLRVERPFGPEDFPDVETFWQACFNWLNPGGEPAPNRAILARFSRFDKIGEPARLRHWTTIDSISQERMHLYDSSHEAEAIQNLPKTAVATHIRDVDETRRFYMHCDSVRFLRLPF